MARLCDHTPNALNTKSVLRKKIRLKMAHGNCKSQIAVLEMNGQSVPQRWSNYKLRYMIGQGYGSVVKKTARNILYCN